MSAKSQPVETISGVEYWRCSKCKVVMSEYYFPRDKRKANGLSSWCKACHAANLKVHRARYEIADGRRKG